MLSIDNVNLEPNIKWFIRLTRSGGSLLVYCYQSLTDLQNLVNLIASATVTCAASQQVTLTQATGSPVTLAKFNTEIAWHLVVSGGLSDTSANFQVGPWSDMDAVKHALYSNADIIPYRASALINAGTQLDKKITIVNAGVVYNMEPNDTVRVDSDHLSVDYYTTVRDVSVELTQDSMLMSITTSKFDLITR